MEELKANTNQRDYDKYPIIIEDYNYLFEAMFYILSIFIILYLYFINPYNAHNELSRKFFFMHAIFIIIIPGLLYYLKLAKSKRTIILNNNFITLKENEQMLIQIDIKKIIKINKTFNDYYSKTQETEGFWALFSYCLTPITITMLIVNKFIFHVFKGGFKSYTFYDSIIAFDNEENFINIMPILSEEHESLRKYFLLKQNIDIKEIDKFIKVEYGYYGGRK